MQAFVTLPLAATGSTADERGRWRPGPGLISSPHRTAHLLGKVAHDARKACCLRVASEVREIAGACSSRPCCPAADADLIGAQWAGHLIF